ncbi:MAG: hypothetical protein HOC20_10745, partial [Chloroflexi bacterium]|jgi:hypothetical protein|nr:hypothetical protein [Chloroflexota bacterium]
MFTGLAALRDTLRIWEAESPVEHLQSFDLGEIDATDPIQIGAQVKGWLVALGLLPPVFLVG